MPKKNFHGGSTPSDLPLPSDPGVTLWETSIDGNTAMDSSVTEAEAVEKKAVAKARNTKKVKEKKKKKKKTVLSHPTYEEMIKDAIVTLKERTGFSQYAIQKFIEEKHKELPPTFRKLLPHNLKRLVASGKLVKVKASFKLPSAKSLSPKAAPTATSIDDEIREVRQGIVETENDRKNRPSVPTKRKSRFDEIREMVLKEKGIDEMESDRKSRWMRSMDPEDPLFPYQRRKDSPKHGCGVDWVVDLSDWLDIHYEMRENSVRQQHEQGYLSTGEELRRLVPQKPESPDGRGLSPGKAASTLQLAQA